MCNSLLVHPLSIQGFDHQRWSFSGKRTTVEYITRQPDRFKCAVCDSHKVTATAVKEREIKAGAIGGDNWILKVKMHRVRCHECNAYCMEHLAQLSPLFENLSLNGEKLGYYNLFAIKYRFIFLFALTPSLM